MKDKTKSLILFILAALLQFFWISGNDLFDRQLPFLSCLSDADSFSGNMLLTMYSYLPFPFLMLMFSGEMRQLLSGYGVLLAVRGESRAGLFGRLTGRTFLQMECIAFAMGLLYTVGRDDWRQHLNLQQQIQALFLYGLVLTVMVQLQFFLELYIQEQYAAGTVILGGAVSLLAWSFFSEPAPFLFPNLAFAARNGILETAEGQMSFAGSLSLLAGLFLSFALAARYKLKRKDLM